TATTSVSSDAIGRFRCASSPDKPPPGGGSSPCGSGPIVERGPVHGGSRPRSVRRPGGGGEPAECPAPPLRARRAPAREHRHAPAGEVPRGPLHRGRRV